MDIKEKILEKIELKSTVSLSQLITKNFKTERMLNSMELATPVTIFRIQHFLRGLSSIVSEFKKQEAMSAIVKIIQTVFEQWEYEFTEQECFVIYHLKDLGKFRLKDDKFYTQLENEWSTFSIYRMDKSEFEQSLKDLKNLKVIDLRRGTIMFNPTVILQ